MESIAELSKESGELLIAPVDIADDVKWAVLMLKVVPQRLSRDRDSGDFIRRGQHEHVAEPFPF